MLQNNDATFDKFKLLCEGEKYVDSSRCAMPCEVAQHSSSISQLSYEHGCISMCCVHISTLSYYYNLRKAY